MFHVEDVLVPDSEQEEHRQHGAADEGDVLGYHGGQRAGEGRSGREELLEMVNSFL